MNIFDSLTSTGNLTVDKCSRKGCTEQASWLLEWNNPKVHTPERRKTWLACDEHRQYLTEFLASRGFLKNCLPHTSGS